MIVLLTQTEEYSLSKPSLGHFCRKIEIKTEYKCQLTLPDEMHYSLCFWQDHCRITSYYFVCKFALWLFILMSGSEYYVKEICKENFFMHNLMHNDMFLHKKVQKMADSFGLKCTSTDFES